MEGLPAPQAAAPALPTAADFLAFVKVHYSTWLETCEGKHPVWFHKCCCCFSTQKTRRRLNHPREEGVSLRLFMKQNGVSNEEELATLLMHISAARPGPEAGQLPGYNEPHTEQPALEKRPPPTEVEELRQQLADQQAALQALQQQHQALQQQNQHLQQQLQLERAAAARHENLFIRDKFVFYRTQQLNQHRGISYPWHAIGTRGQLAASLFRDLYPGLPTFGDLPRPNHPNPPAPALPEDPGFEDLLHQFLSDVVDGEPDDPHN